MGLLDHFHGVDRSYHEIRSRCIDSNFNFQLKRNIYLSMCTSESIGSSEEDEETLNVLQDLKPLPWRSLQQVLEIKLLI